MLLNNFERRYADMLDTTLGHIFWYINHQFCRWMLCSSDKNKTKKLFGGESDLGWIISFIVNVPADFLHRTLLEHHQAQQYLVFAVLQAGGHETICHCSIMNICLESGCWIIHPQVHLNHVTTWPFISSTLDLIINMLGFPIHSNTKTQR